MKHQTVSLLKFKLLMRRLRMPLWQAVGVLESIWLFAQHNARDGDLTAYIPDGLTAWLEWDDDFSELLEALIETRWLDRDGHRVLIHDWAEHKPNWLKGCEASSYTKRGRRRTPAPKQSEPPATTPSVAPSVGLSPTPPNLTQPNQTKPLGGVPPKGTSADVQSGDGVGLQLVTGEAGTSQEEPHEQTRQAAKRLTTAWNSTPGVRRFESWNDARRAAFRARLKDRVQTADGKQPWLEVALDVLKGFPLKCFEVRTDGYLPDLDWFLRPKTVVAILEGKYNFVPGGAKQQRPKRKALA